MFYGSFSCLLTANKSQSWRLVPLSQLGLFRKPCRKVLSVQIKMPLSCTVNFRRQSHTIKCLWKHDFKSVSTGMAMITVTYSGCATPRYDTGRAPHQQHVPVFTYPSEMRRGLSSCSLYSLSCHLSSARAKRLHIIVFLISRVHIVHSKNTYIHDQEWVDASKADSKTNVL